MARRLPLEIVVPLRWEPGADLREMTHYLRELARTADVTVVDGSPAEAFGLHAAAWAGTVRHLRPLPWPGRNGKVAGVVTGVRAARHEHVVVADDDVRWDEAGLRRMAALLERADVVRPQNVFSPQPWHARWDTGRTLLNRALGADYPGTFGLRRSTFCRMGGYDGDVLFENLQMLRTVRAAGGVELRAPDLFVLRRPPTARHFLGQRVRQAYDDFAQPARLVWEASWLPGLLLAGRRPRRGARAALAAAATAVVVAEAGRRRHGGRAAFGPGAALWAPAWAAERTVCVWLAILARARGGVRYSGSRVRDAAVPPVLRPPLQPLPERAPEPPSQRAGDRVAARSGEGHGPGRERVASPTG
ncbi:glycosyl transferase family 2 [Kineococcus xinjiangensis]|uniref:Glycosyl transferase family 2 n=1 Tax=Kineococcus xinjiangensis TaxID=512762 RepID=A0A2S6IPB5_9ACTN|nr:glycosyltransferase [Kineococcus xinjiangensis]PPK95936.1 glycosyl transferase family 2 [Kineococcus xinjiangensis]